MSDKLIDQAAERIADQHPSVYKLHEKLAYAKYVATAKAAGLTPKSYNAIRRVNESVKGLSK